MINLLSQMIVSGVLLLLCDGMLVSGVAHVCTSMVHEL